MGAPSVRIKKHNVAFTCNENVLGTAMISSTPARPLLLLLQPMQSQAEYAEAGTM